MGTALPVSILGGLAPTPPSKQPGSIAKENGVRYKCTLVMIDCWKAA